MRTHTWLWVLCVASLVMWPGTRAAAQHVDPPKGLTARIPVYVTTVEGGTSPAEFMQPGTDPKALADSVNDIQDALTAKGRWVRLVPDREAAVIGIRVTRRTYDDGPEVMSVYTDVMVGAYTIQITGAGDPWRDAARSVVRQLDEWVALNYSRLRDRAPAQLSSRH